jgi:hypothetical protein
MTDRQVQTMLDRLKINADAARENPTIGNAELLDAAHKMIYDLRNKLRFRKPYDRSNSD